MQAFPKTRLWRFVGMPLLIMMLGVGLYFFSGCGSSRATSTGADRLTSFGHFPTILRIQHPDTVLHADQSFNELERMWSAGFTDIHGGRFYRTGRHRTFATLWSKELSMSWVGHRANEENLSELVALELADEMAEAYLTTVKIVIHVFVTERFRDAYRATDFSFPGTHVELIDNHDNRYTPAEMEWGRAELVRLSSFEPGVYYRPNAFYFPRIVDGRDILDEVTRLRLLVSNSPSVGGQIYFTWDFGASRSEL